MVASIPGHSLAESTSEWCYNESLGKSCRLATVRISAPSQCLVVADHGEEQKFKEALGGSLL